MIVFLCVTAGLTLAVAVVARLLLRRLSGLATTLSLIILSTLYFLAIFQIARPLMGDAP
jgi:hypothetical protein